MPYQLKNPPAFDIPITEDELQLIGLICAIWAQIEGEVDRVIARLAKMRNHDSMRILLDRRDMRTKIDMAKELAETYDPAVLPTLDPIYRALLKYITK